MPKEVLNTLLSALSIQTKASVETHLSNQQVASFDIDKRKDLLVLYG
ncbi:hypothetical protein [Parashewanella tropica]|nr:hypothetical protein [Parashewanella tropica]